MKVLQRLKIFSFAKFQAILMTYVGLIAGILYSFGWFAIDFLVSLKWMNSSEIPSLSFGALLVFGALVGMPILFVAGCFLIGIIEGILYNYFSKWFSSIKIDFYQKKDV